MYFFAGASMDGIFNNCGVEVKCPSSLMNADLNKLTEKQLKKHFCGLSVPGLQEKATAAPLRKPPDFETSPGKKRSTLRKKTRLDTFIQSRYM